MSNTEVIGQGSNFLHVRHNTAKTFIGDNDYRADEVLENATGGELTYEEGTLLGRVTATGNLVPCVSGAADGSQFPVGILASCRTIAAAGTSEVSLCIGGNIREGALILDAGDTLESVVDGRQLKDLIAQLNIYIRPADELSQPDNE